MLTNVFNKIIDFLEKGEEVEFSCGGPYLETNWIKNPLDDNDTNILDMYIIDEVCTQSFFTDVGSGSKGIFKFTTDSLDFGLDEECKLFLDCIVEIYDEDGEVEKVDLDTLNVH